MNTKESDTIKNEIYIELKKNEESISEIEKVKTELINNNKKGIVSLNNYYDASKKQIENVSSTYYDINNLFELRLKLSLFSYFILFLLVQYFYIILDIELPSYIKNIIYFLLLIVTYYVVNIYAMSKLYNKEEKSLGNYDYNIKLLKKNTSNDINMNNTFTILNNLNNTITSRMAAIKDFLPWIPEFIKSIEFESECNLIKNKIYQSTSKYDVFKNIKINNIPYPLRNKEASIEKYYINKISELLNISDIYLALLYYNYYNDYANEIFYYEIIKNNKNMLNNFINFIKNLKIVNNNYSDNILKAILINVDKFDAVKINLGYDNYIYISNKIHKFIKLSNNENIIIKNINLLNELINDKIYKISYTDKDEYEYYYNYFIKYVDLKINVEKEKIIYPLMVILSSKEINRIRRYSNKMCYETNTVDILYTYMIISELETEKIITFYDSLVYKNKDKVNKLKEERPHIYNKLLIYLKNGEWVDSIKYMEFLFHQELLENMIKKIDKLKDNEDYYESIKIISNSIISQNTIYQAIESNSITSYLILTDTMKGHVADLLEEMKKEHSDLFWFKNFTRFTRLGVVPPNKTFTEIKEQIAEHFSDKENVRSKIIVQRFILSSFDTTQIDLGDSYVEPWRVIKSILINNSLSLDLTTYFTLDFHIKHGDFILSTIWEKSFYEIINDVLKYNLYSKELINKVKSTPIKEIIIDSFDMKDYEEFCKMINKTDSKMEILNRIDKILKKEIPLIKPSESYELSKAFINNSNHFHIFSTKWKTS